MFTNKRTLGSKILEIRRFLHIQIKSVNLNTVHEPLDLHVSFFFDLHFYITFVELICILRTRVRKFPCFRFFLGLNNNISGSSIYDRKSFLNMNETRFVSSNSCAKYMNESAR